MRSAISVDANGKAVEGGRDATWKLGLEVGVKVVVREVRQIRPLRAHLARHGERFGNAEVRRMLRAEQRVDHEYPRASELVDAVRWQTLGVGDVCQRSDAITEN